MHWPALLLVVLLCFLALVEIGTRLLVRRISRVEGRTSAEYEAAIAPAPASGKPVVLLLGNSLLDSALDFPRLRNEAAERWDVRRFVVENTSYYDWHYGIRRLFAGGARPQVVMLMLSGGQLASSGSRGEYSAYTLVSRDDIFHFAEDLNLHPTNAANVVFANLSMFYGLRSEIRKVLIGKVLPDLPSLTVRLLPAPLGGAGGDSATATDRVRMLRDECARHGARFVFVAPPLLRFQEASKLQSVVASAGVDVVVAYKPGDFNASDFSDGFHLNNQGAVKYTANLIDYWRSQGSALMAASGGYSTAR